MERTDRPVLSNIKRPEAPPPFQTESMRPGTDPFTLTVDYCGDLMMISSDLKDQIYLDQPD